MLQSLTVAYFMRSRFTRYMCIHIIIITKIIKLTPWALLTQKQRSQVISVQCPSAWCPLSLTHDKLQPSGRSQVSILSEIGLWLTPSLPEPVKFLGWMMPLQTRYFYFQCYAFWWTLFHIPVRKKKKEKLKSFKFCTFNGHFQMTSWQWRG